MVIASNFFKEKADNFDFASSLICPALFQFYNIHLSSEFGPLFDQCKFIFDDNSVTIEFLSKNFETFEVVHVSKFLVEVGDNEVSDADN